MDFVLSNINIYEEILEISKFWNFLKVKNLKFSNFFDLKLVLTIKLVLFSSDELEYSHKNFENSKILKISKSF